MAEIQAVWGIEIGQCALKALRISFDAVKQRAEALGFDYIEHPKILSQPDADPEELARQALRTFLARNNVKGDRVCIGVPGQSGLARFIKLPPVEQSRIPEIVRYEARQQIPFALEEVIWDYQTMGGKGDEDEEEEGQEFALETEVGLFAMKRELVQRYMAPFMEAGVEVDVVQMRPLAAYNFCVFDQLPKERGPARDEADEQESEYQREELLDAAQQAAAAEFVLLLDIGADNSDLVITNGTQIWQRNLPLGGNHFTRALTKELKLTFAKAEHLKRNAAKAQDPRAIFQAMRPVFNDLVSEIQRSVGYFASVHRQSKISRIIGMGNAFKLPGLQKFLSQNLHYEVVKVDQFRRLAGAKVLKSPLFQENMMSFGVAYGLALQGAGVSVIRTSLLPPEITQARMIRAKKPWMLTAAAALLVGFTFLFAGNWRVLHAVNRPEYLPAEQKAKQAQDLQARKKQQFEQAKASWAGVKSTGETLTSIVDDRLAWLEVLAAINKALPTNPANVDRKKIKQLKELQITEMSATWYQDVKTEWYDTLAANQWFQGTQHNYDKVNPPSGPGWVFELYGHHFNDQAAIYTLEALRRLQTAEVRLAGINAAVLVDNVTIPDWVPGTATDRQRFTSRRRRGSSGARSSMFGRSSFAASSSVMGSNMSAASSGAGSSQGSVSDERKMEASFGATTGGSGSTGYGSGQEEVYQQFGAAGAPMGSDYGYGQQGGFRTTSRGGQAKTALPTKIRSLARTDFVIEFAWQPDKKQPPEALAQLRAAIEQAGAGQGLSAELLQQSIERADTQSANQPEAKAPPGKPGPK